MSHPLLAIIVPTYNRASCLEALLSTLAIELDGLEGQVWVILGDNASTDRTPELINHFAQRWADTLILRQNTNVGADENFCHCIEKATSTYFWIIGDDDLPRAGVVRALLALLEQTAPDLVYLHSRPIYQSLNDGTERDNKVSFLDAVFMDQLAFACRVHVWTTFISGCVVHRKFAPDSELRRFSGTNLVQLGWTLAALKFGSRFVFVKTPSVFATPGNTGGYSVLKVFGQNFQRITREVFSDDAHQRQVGEAMITRTSIAYLPGLVWSFRHAKLGKFDQSERISTAMDDQLGRSMAYHLLIRPVEYLPAALAWGVLKGSRILARLLGLHDRISGRILGCVKPT